MIKSIIIMALVLIIGYSYVTGMSVKQIINDNAITFQTPIKVNKDIKF